MSTAIDLHRECWELLPWLVNETLGEAARVKVEAHLRDCAECREETEAQQRLRARIAASDGAVAYSPAASFEKLSSRIEELEREVPVEHAGVPGGSMSVPLSMQPAVRPRARLHPDGRLSRWLVAAVIVQAVALAWLASTSMESSRTAAEWSYRTVTSGDDTRTLQPLYRVVFDSATPLAELQRVLATHGLVIVHAAPSSGVFTVAGDMRGSAKDQELLEQLRREPTVRFVELAPQGRSP